MTTGPYTPPRWQAEMGEVLTSIGEAPAALAACRRGLGKKPMDVPAMWPYVVRVTERASGSSDHWPYRVEAAVHHTLALYATHQQGKSDPMHRRSDADHPGPRFGRACRTCAQSRGERDRPDEGVRRRFYSAATADSLDELIGHLRGLVTLLRGESIPVDYVRLAADLAAWPNPEWRNSVRRRWGRDYERATDRAPEPSTTA